MTALIQDLEMNKGEEMNLKTTLRLFARGCNIVDHDWHSSQAHTQF
jgi:hypothetical protein